MKIAFRRVPFHSVQRAALTELIHHHGHEALWLSDALPSAADLKDCEVLMGYFPPEILKDLPNLKWLQTPAAGVDKLCGDLYADDNVMLTNCSGVFGITIAEYMFTGILMLMRLMPSYAENQKNHIWNCEGFCRSIYGSTITVIGMGDIGTAFAKRASAFGAYVRGVRKSGYKNAEYFDEVFYTEDLYKAVEGADVVVCCLPGTKETTGLISEECLSHMKKDAIFVNCGRGYTVDQNALTAALLDKRLAGAVLDVAAKEPLDPDDSLWDIPNVIITPHISGHDDDPVNANAIFEFFINNLRHYFAGEPLDHVVDRSVGY